MSTASTLCQMHQLLPSKHRLSFPQPEASCWNFARIPAAGHGEEEEEEEDIGYVHPLSKRSFSSLSSKSLEMCTESLGSETGSDIDLTRDEERDHEAEKQGASRGKAREAAKKVRQGGGFPPPLTSISGVRVRPHREGGRLVIKAFSFASGGSYFQAERGDGRLRLSLLEDGGKEAEEKEKEEEEAEQENVEEAENEESGDEGEAKGGFRGGEKIGCKIGGGSGGGGEWSGSRCSGGRGSRKRLQKSLQCCMAIS